MDPFTHGILGAITARLFARNNHPKLAALGGALGGMAPDLDVIIRSADDSLLALDFHRHFTHALVFSPIGGAIVAAFLWLFCKSRLSFKALFFYCTLGYGLHGLLDAATTYGTHLFWPFSHARTAWDSIAIIDPVFTLILLLGLVLSLCSRYSTRAAQMGVALASAYFAFCLLQHSRIMDATEALAAQRGDTVERVRVMPTIGNAFLWRTLYASNGVYHVDALRSSLTGKITLYEGGTVESINPETIYPALPPNSVQREDIKRFDFFADGYSVLQPGKEHVIGDLRYALFPHSTVPIWGIEVNEATPDAHAQFRNFRQMREGDLTRFWRMIKGELLVP